jgi:excisionase family DNA binding protein
MLTVPQAATELNLCRGTIYKLVRGGYLDLRHFGKAARITRKSMNRLKAHGAPRPTSPRTFDEAA